MKWIPQPKQEIALAHPAFELFFGGAKGGGKSDFLLIDFTKGIKRGSHYKGVLFRRTYPELEELLERSYAIYPLLGAKYSKTTRTWSFPSGSSLKMRFLEKDNDVLKYQGHQYQWIGFDELTNWATDYCYIFMMSCARAPHGGPVLVRSSGNPGTIGHVWVRRRFIDPSKPGYMFKDERTGLTRVFIRSLLDDNIALMENDPLYETRLKLLPRHLYRAYRYGDWSVFSGQVFEEFNQAHVVRPFNIEYYYKFASLDWGYDKPFSVGYWASVGDGRLIRFDEWYGCHSYEQNKGIRMNAKEVAKQSLERHSMMGCNEMVMDPSCWNAQGHTEGSIADEFEDAGWYTEKGINNRVTGLSKFHDLLKDKGHDGRPQMLIFDHCRNFIRNIPELVYSETRLDDVDDRQEDHIYDETRYGILSTLAQHEGLTAREIISKSVGVDQEVKEWDPLGRQYVS